MYPQDIITDWFRMQTIHSFLVVKPCGLHWCRDPDCLRLNVYERCVTSSHTHYFLILCRGKWWAWRTWIWHDHEMKKTVIVFKDIFSDVELKKQHSLYPLLLLLTHPSLSRWPYLAAFWPQHCAVPSLKENPQRKEKNGKTRNKRGWRINEHKQIWMTWKIKEPLSLWCNWRRRPQNDFKMKN